jgi:hypothetical protein
LGSSSSKPAGKLADCKTADGQSVASMLVNVALLSTCNSSLASALLTAVEDVVAEAVGDNSKAQYDVAAAGCSVRFRVRATPVTLQCC